MRRITLGAAAVFLAVALARASEPEKEVERIMQDYRAALPSADDLGVFRLDWVATLDEAKRRAADERRPILLLVVTNSYGNLYTGHC
jgi:hypothetical protein